MHIADFLSRAPTHSKEFEKEYEIYQLSTADDTSLRRLDQIDALEGLRINDQQLVRIRDATRNDFNLKELTELIRHGWPDDERQLSETMKPYW